MLNLEKQMCMKNYDFLQRNDEELYDWAGNFINIFDHYLVKLTPKLKEETSVKLFNMSYKELSELIEVTKNYRQAFDGYNEKMTQADIQKSEKEKARENMKSLVNKRIELLKKSAIENPEIGRKLDILEEPETTNS